MACSETKEWNRRWKNMEEIKDGLETKMTERAEIESKVERKWQKMK
jgi:hypothetical protein